MKISRCINTRTNEHTYTVRKQIDNKTIQKNFNTLEDAERCLDEIEKENGVKKELPTGITSDKQGIRVRKMINGVNTTKRFKDLDSAIEFLNSL